MTGAGLLFGTNCKCWHVGVRTLETGTFLCPSVHFSISLFSVASVEKLEKIITHFLMLEKKTPPHFRHQMWLIKAD